MNVSLTLTESVTAEEQWPKHRYRSRVTTCTKIYTPLSDDFQAFITNQPIQAQMTGELWEWLSPAVNMVNQFQFDEAVYLIQQILKEMN